MFLLLNYGFALEDNKYDSFHFYVNMALNKIKDVSLPEWFERRKSLAPIDHEPLLQYLKPKTKPHPIGNRLLLEYYHIQLPGIDPCTLKLKKDYLC